jgi:hypothetical protein
MLVPISKEQLQRVDRARGEYSRGDYIQLLASSLESKSFNLDRDAVENLRADDQELSSGQNLRASDHELVALPEKVVQLIDEIRNEMSRTAFIGLALSHAADPNAPFDEEATQGNSDMADETAPPKEKTEVSGKNGENSGSVNTQPSSNSLEDQSQKTNPSSVTSGQEGTSYSVQKSSRQPDRDLLPDNPGCQPYNRGLTRPFVIIWTLAMATFFIIRWALKSEPPVQINI